MVVERNQKEKRTVDGHRWRPEDKRVDNGQVIAIVGVLAAIASTVSFAPQAWRIIRTRDTEGLSAGMYMLTVAAFALWLTYGFLRGDWALVAPNALCLILSLFILVMIILPARSRAKVASVIEGAVVDAD